MRDGRLVSGSRDRTIRLWDPSGVQPPQTLEGHMDWVTSLAVLADGRLASGAGDRTIRLWDASGSRPPHTLEGHTSWVTSLAVLPDGRLASGSGDRTIRLWDTLSGAGFVGFVAEAPIHGLSTFGECGLAAWDASGHMHFLHVQSLS